jgi:hypothetical protein
MYSVNSFYSGFTQVQETFTSGCDEQPNGKVDGFFAEGSGFIRIFWNLSGMLPDCRHGIIMVLVLLFVGCGFIAVPHANAQSSLVPLTHPVYSWLEYQRAEGRITAYHQELAPYSRTRITEFLRAIEQSERSLGWFQNQILQSYIREFDREQLRQSNYRRSWNAREGYRDRLIGLWLDQPEHYLFRYSTENQQIEAYLYGMRYRAIVDTYDDGEWRWARYYAKGVRGFMNVGDHIGFHGDIDNVYALGDQLLLRLDPDWGSSAAIDWRWEERASYSYETFANVEYPLFNLVLGRGSLNFGPYVSEPLVFRRTAPNMSWIRYTIGNEKINVTYMHAALQSYAADSEIMVNGELVTTRTFPARWMVMRRLNLEPVPWVTLGFFEVLQYSNRSIDLGYLNPVVPYIFLESDAARDSDQNYAGMDIRLRLLPGNMVFGTLFLDDFYTFSDMLLFRESLQAVNVGFTQNLPFSSQIGMSYTRIDPYMYTHKFRLNAFEVNGDVLGHSIGPNATEWAWRWKTWLPLRINLTLQSSLVRKGMNPMDADGNAIDVGGDYLSGFPFRRQLFLDADMHRYWRHSLELHVEPIRGYSLALRMWTRRVTEGEQIRDFQYLDFRFGFGF